MPDSLSPSLGERRGHSQIQLLSASRLSQNLAESNVRYLKQDAQQVVNDGVRFCGKLLDAGGRDLAEDTARRLHDWAGDQVGLYNKALDNAGLHPDATLDLAELNELLGRFK